MQNDKFSAKDKDGNYVLGPDGMALPNSKVDLTGLKGNQEEQRQRRIDRKLQSRTPSVAGTSGRPDAGVTPNPATNPNLTPEQIAALPPEQKAVFIRNSLKIPAPAAPAKETFAQFQARTANSAKSASINTEEKEEDDKKLEKKIRSIVMDELKKRAK
jgi:hypothetical protein